MNRSKLIKRFESELFVVTRMTGDTNVDIDQQSPGFVDGYWYGRRVSIEDTLRSLKDGDWDE